MYADDPRARADWQAVVRRLSEGAWQAAFAELRQLVLDRVVRGRALSVSDRIAAETLASLAVALGHQAAAEDIFQALVLLNRQTDQHYAADFLTITCAEVALLQQRYDAARDYLASLAERLGPLEDIPWSPAELPAWEERIGWSASRTAADRWLFLGHFYAVAGRWLAAQGCHGHAACLAERGVQLLAPQEDSESRDLLIAAALCLAAVRLEQGEIADADSQLQRVHNGIDRLSQPAQYARWLELSAQCRLLRGQYGAALDLLAETTALCVERGFAGAAQRALLNEAEVQILLNQLSAAAASLQQAAALAQALADAAAARRCDWLGQLLEARAHSSTAEFAIPSITELHRHWRRETASAREAPTAQPLAADCYTRFLDRLLQVQWSLAANETDRAAVQLQDLQLVFQEAESPLIQLRLHLLAAQVAYHRQCWQEAQQAAEEVLPHLEERGLWPDVYATRRLLGWCAERLERPRSVIEDLDRQTQACLKLLADSLGPQHRALYLLNKWTVEERGLAAEIDVIIDQHGRHSRAAWWKRWWTWWTPQRSIHSFLHKLDDHRRLLARRALQSAADPSARATAAGPLWRRLATHPRDTATLSFLCLPDRVVVACVAWCDQRFIIRPVTRVQLRRVVRQWHELSQAWYERSAVNVAALEEVSRELSELLGLARLLEALPDRVKHLRIVADDALVGFPFAALHLSDGRSLIDRFSLVFCNDRAVHTQQARAALRAAALFAVSAGDAGLPNALPEAASIARQLQHSGIQAQLLKDEQVRRESVLERFANRGVGLVHMACHGIFRPDSPAASGLVMYSEDNEHELVSVHDVAQLDLSHLRHVTLSSCWGADSYIAPGRWIVSLPEALLRSGVGSVLASLWQVRDAEGKDFAIRFYQELATKSRGAALQATQLAFRADPATAHPLYWSGFVLHGDGSPLAGIRALPPPLADLTQTRPLPTRANVSA